jgi:hypothetical protein
LLLLGLNLLALQQNANSEPGEIIAESGTLVLLGSSATDITLAADSAVQTRQGIKTGAQKIFQIGKFAACALLRSSAIEYLGRSGKVEDTANFVGIIRLWASTHPSVSVTDANDSLFSLLSKEFKRFYSNHHTGVEVKTPILLTLVCVGYSFGVPLAFVTTFAGSMENKDFEPSVNKASWALPPSMFGPLGEKQVCEDVLHGSSPGLDKYRQTESVQKYRNLQATKSKLYRLSADDLIQLSMTCLRATESAAGRKFDKGAFLVAAPNHYVVISSMDGFRELPRPH